jgi:hypothetical protein
MMNFDLIINYINNGGSRDNENIIITSFRKWSNVAKFLITHNKIEKINLGNLYTILYRNDEESEFNMICHSILKKYGSDYFVNYLDDVSVVDNEFYISLPDLSYLSNIFNYEDISNVVNGVFGQDWYKYFYVDKSSIYYYSDIIEILNDNNLITIKEIILEACGDNNFDEESFNYNLPSDYFDENDEFNVSDNIEVIMTDSELFKFVIELDCLRELKSSLSDLYSMAYNEAWNEQMFERIWSELSEFFSKDVVWEDDFVKIKIKDFNIVLDHYFRDIGDSETNIIEDYSYIKILHSLFLLGIYEEPNIRLLPYPSDDLVSNYINDSLSDYIY